MNGREKLEKRGEVVLFGPGRWEGRFNQSRIHGEWEKVFLNGRPVGTFANGGFSFIDEPGRKFVFRAKENVQSGFKAYDLFEVMETLCAN